jgi:hypothetical protein
MSKVKEQNYVVIQGWMLSKLQLKGNDLLIYAIIYGFSQNADCKFTGSLQYLADWTNSTKQGVLNSLKNLLDKKLITKKDYIINGVKFVEYHSNDFNEVVKKVEQGWSNDFNGGGQMILPNNTSDKLIDNSINKKDITTASGFSSNENLVSVKNGKIDIKTNQHGQTDILCPCDQGRLEETLQEDKYFCCECSSIYSKNEVLNIIGFKNSVSVNNAHTQTSYQGNLDNSTGKENLQVESVADKSYILNSQEKAVLHPRAKQPILAQKTAENGVNTNGSTLAQNSGYSVEFEEFWEKWGLMCKEKGSATGTKKEAYNEWQKVYKICGHQGIMRVLGAFIQYILIAFEPNKHACRWFKIIEWKDIETVINDYKTQAENIKAVNISKQKSKTTNGFNKQPQAPITIKAVVTPEQQNEATEIEARRIKRHSQMKPNEVECLEKLKPTLKNYFGDSYKPTIEKLILNIKGNEYTFFEGVSVFTRQGATEKLAMIVKRELQNDDIEIKVQLI